MVTVAFHDPLSCVLDALQVLEAEALQSQQEMDEFWEQDPKGARQKYLEAVEMIRNTTRTDW